MNLIFRMVGAAVLACTLVSCAVVNGAGGMVGRLLQTMTRAVGMAEVGEPRRIDREVGDPANVEARGHLIETQGAYGTPFEASPRREKMASSH